MRPENSYCEARKIKHLTTSLILLGNLSFYSFANVVNTVTKLFSLLSVKFT